jgi:hypothetical protein
MINFTVSALLGPVFGSRLLGVSEGAGALAHYQAGSNHYSTASWALVLTLFLKETAPTAKKN